MSACEGVCTGAHKYGIGDAIYISQRRPARKSIKLFPFCAME